VSTSLKNAVKIECSNAFPPTALSAKIKVSNIVPRGSAVLIYTPATGDRSVKFCAPEFVADVPLQGHEMYAQKILGCETYQIQFLGYCENPLPLDKTPG
jgi:hypothetical protein